MKFWVRLYTPGLTNFLKMEMCKAFNGLVKEIFVCCMPVERIPSFGALIRCDELIITR